ncbi:hypothetical protein Syun_020353 [Stephania yunnanensis]|uniref:Uncharacterized protein n=1 Tax=Stephania yunnanensis TaxID=152371 RepID=A0AAP0IDS0_9MAGN
MEFQFMLLILLPTLLGIYSSFKALLSFLNWTWTAFFRRPKDLRRRYGSWAIVTGATDGIGKAASFELASRGLNLLLLGRNLSKLQLVTKEIHHNYFAIDIKTLVIDFSKDSGSEIVRKVREVIKGLDVGVLINNAGVSHKYASFVHEVESGVVESIVRVNIEGVMWVTKAVVPLMMERRRGAVVNIGSASASC